MIPAASNPYFVRVSLVAYTDLCGLLSFSLSRTVHTLHVGVNILWVTFRVGHLHDFAIHGDSTPTRLAGYFTTPSCHVPPGSSMIPSYIAT